MALTSFRGIFAAGSVGLAALTGVIGFVACSSDSTDTTTTGSSDGGNDGGGFEQVDASQANACADAGPPTHTCTAKGCTAQNGEPSICVNDQCVKLKSDECQFVSGATDDDNALVVGSMFDLKGTDKIAGGYRQNSVELAVAEINQAGGIPTGDGCGHRPLLYVSCDESVAFNADAGITAPSRRRAAKHLAEDLKAIGIVGPGNSNNTIEIATNVTDPDKQMIVAPTAGAAEITTIANATQDGVRVLWRTVPSDALQGKAVSKYGDQIATELARPTLKAAIVNRDDAFGRGLRDGVKQYFQPNGKPWGDPANAANVVDVSYATSGTPAYQAAIDAMFALQPDIIFWFGLGEITPNIIVPYEKKGPTTKPMWISTTSGQRAEIISALGTDQAFKDTGIQARVRGTSAQLTTALSQDFFNFRYKTKYSDPKTLIFGQTQSYDGTYLIALSAAAAKPGWGPLASIDVARGMSKMVGGIDQIDVGPTKLKSAFEKLRQGGAIDFNGASGQLDFDPSVGEAQGDYAIWCVRTDPNTSTPVFENVTGMTWRYKTNALEGTFSCPQN